MQQKFPMLGLSLAALFCYPNHSLFADEAQSSKKPEFLWEISKNHLKNPLRWPSIWTQAPQTTDANQAPESQPWQKEVGSEKNGSTNYQSPPLKKNTDWTLNEEKRTQRYLDKVRPLRYHGFETLPAPTPAEQAASIVESGPVKYYLSQALILSTPFLTEVNEGEGFYPNEAKLKYSAANESEILQPFDEVTIYRGLESGVKVGDLFRTYAVGDRYQSFTSGRNLGRLVETNGIVQITRVASRTSVGRLIKCFGTISHESRACPLLAPPEVVATGYASVPEGKLIAQVVLVTQEQQFPQPFSYAIVDRGAKKGFKIGDMVLFFNRNQGQLTDKVLGNGLVVSVQEQSSTILIKDLYPGIINRGDYTVVVQTTVL
jgi:hypothetical protein